MLLPVIQYMWVCRIPSHSVWLVWRVQNTFDHQCHLWEVRWLSNICHSPFQFRTCLLQNKASIEWLVSLQSYHDDNMYTLVILSLYLPYPPTTDLISIDCHSLNYIRDGDFKTKLSWPCLWEPTWHCANSQYKLSTFHILNLYHCTCSMEKMVSIFMEWHCYEPPGPRISLPHNFVCAHPHLQLSLYTFIRVPGKKWFSYLWNDTDEPPGPCFRITSSPTFHTPICN